MASEEARYLSARLDRFRAAGLTGSAALFAAENRHVDLREFERLVDRGAPPMTALRIVWPLDDEVELVDDYQGLQDHGDQSRPLATK